MCVGCQTCTFVNPTGIIELDEAEYQINIS